MVAEPDFNQHLYKFNKIIVELDSLELKIEEEDKVLLVFVLLPSSFHGIMTTLMFGKETLKFDEVASVLLMNETQQGNNGLSNDGQVAIITKESS